MMITIRNEFAEAGILPLGAELRSLVNLQNGIQYMWQADPAFWPKSSPVLFPIVGTLKSGSCSYNNNRYSLGRHGFARDRNFEVAAHTNESVTFKLKSDDISLFQYPFPFRLDITYLLDGKTLEIKYTVTNEGQNEMFFSIGAHPAFNVPLEKDKQYEDYKLEFNQKENADRWPISPEGLIVTESVPCLRDTNSLPLKKELFYQDAIVFKDLKSDEITLGSQAGSPGLTVRFPGFSHLGIWAMKNADFVCIEPWCGIADSVDAGGLIQDKEGIMSLDAGANREISWSICIF